MNDYIKRLLKQAPPLSTDQRRILSGLFTGGASA